MDLIDFFFQKKNGFFFKEKIKKKIKMQMMYLGNNTISYIPDRFINLNITDTCKPEKNVQRMGRDNS